MLIEKENREKNTKVQNAYTTWQKQTREVASII